jgi:beta-glucanase (GH16 family)
VILQIAKIVGVIAPLGLLCAAAHAMPPSSCPAPQPASNMVTTLDSDFANAGRLDTSQWRPFVGLHGDIRHELEAFVPSEVRVIPSVGLVLQTDKRTFLDHPFVSGEVTTRGLVTQTYGHFEMLAKMPEANGLWPAFWLVPANGTWPPEIDIVEYIYAPWGKTPNKTLDRTSYPQTTLHWVDTHGQYRAMGQGYNSSILAYQTDKNWGSTPAPRGVDRHYVGYHKYAVDWRPGSLVWFIDGSPVFCIADNEATGQRVPDVPMYIVLDDAVSPGDPRHPGWPGYIAANQKLPQAFDIAYVHVSQFKDLPAAPPLSLEIREVTLSNPRPKPGQIVKLMAQLRIGNSDLKTNGFASFAIQKFGAGQYDGIGPDVDNVLVRVPELKANRSYAIMASYRVPKKLEPGLYSVGVAIDYTDSNNMDAGRNARLPQGALLTISAAPGD